MIYLIEDRDYVKIGYAEDVDKRFKQYKTYSLYPKLISYKIGSTEDEKKLHKLCEQWHISGEWFQNCKEVKDIFDNYDTTFDLLNLKKIVCHNLSLLESIMKRYQYKDPDVWARFKPKYLTKAQLFQYKELERNQLLSIETQIWFIYYRNIEYLITGFSTQIREWDACDKTVEYFFNRYFDINIIINKNIATINTQRRYYYKNYSRLNSKEEVGD